MKSGFGVKSASKTLFYILALVKMKRERGEREKFNLCPGDTFWGFPTWDLERGVSEKEDVVGSYYTTADDRKFCDRFIEESRGRLVYRAGASRDRRWTWDGEHIGLGEMFMKLSDAAAEYQVGEKVKRKANTLSGVRAYLDYMRWQLEAMASVDEEECAKG